MEDAWLGEAILKFPVPILRKPFPYIIDVEFTFWPDPTPLADHPDAP